MNVRRCLRLSLRFRLELGEPSVASVPTSSDGSEPASATFSIGEMLAEDPNCRIDLARVETRRRCSIALDAFKKSSMGSNSNNFNHSASPRPASSFSKFRHLCLRLRLRGDVTGDATTTVATVASLPFQLLLNAGVCLISTRGLRDDGATDISARRELLLLSAFWPKPRG